jgi:threonine dehydrogenase-like Zn-dependent dehydrogenase
MDGAFSFVKYPLIPGHEPLGVIEQIGERAAARWGVQVGDRVAPESFVPCNHCRYCLSGHYTLCNNGRSHGYTPIEIEPSVWGGFSDYMYLHPNTIVHKVPKDISPEVAVMYNPLGAGVRWACQVPQTQLGETVVVLGPGQRGLACVIAAKAGGAGQVIITGLSRDEPKLCLARELGADYTIDVERESTLERIREITGGELADIVIDVSPYATQPVVDALDVVRPGGRIVLAGLKGGRGVPNFETDKIVLKAVTIQGVMGVDASAYREAIKIIASRRFPLERLHTHTFGLEDAARAIEILAGRVSGENGIHISVAPGT